jgi:hypothetical protein
VRNLLALLVLLVPAIAAAAPKSNPAFLGIEMGDLPNNGGVIVRRVTTGSPAADPDGLQFGDVLLQINGGRVQNGLEATAAITASRPGDLLELDIRRSGAPIHVSVRLSTRSEVLYRRFGGRSIDPIEVVATNGQDYDLSALRGHATIVGWFNASRCVGCTGVFNRIHGWIQRSSKATLALAITNEAGDIASLQNMLDVPIARAPDELADPSLFGEQDRIQFMVIDCRGDVQFIAPIAPNSDDLDASLDDLFAAAAQAERRR